MTDPDIFNLMIAATVRCRVAMIRIDYIIWTDSGFTKLVPRIASRLITVRQTIQKPEADSPLVCYMVSIGGNPFFSPYVKPLVMRWLLRRADFAQIFVPSDYSETDLPEWDILGQPGAGDGLTLTMHSKVLHGFMFEKRQANHTKMLKPYDFHNQKDFESINSRYR